jgi:hypothetical protein
MALRVKISPRTGLQDSRAAQWRLESCLTTPEAIGEHGSSHALLGLAFWHASRGKQPKL